jgi:hypothetical protein
MRPGLFATGVVVACLMGGGALAQNAPQPAPAATATAAPAIPMARYAATEGEYSILLPEAPTVATIWPGSGLPSTLGVDAPADSPSLGETATYRRVDGDTGENIAVTVTTLKATPASLESLTQEKITAILESQVADLSLEKKDVSFSGGSKTLKWGILTGYEIDAQQRITFHAVHYLSGLQSMNLVRIAFSLENRRFKADYETIGRSIKYTGR